MDGPAGHGVDAKGVHKAPPSNINEKICKRTAIRRLAEKGYRPEKKINKSDPGPALATKRIAFSGMDRARKSSLVGVGDFEDFTFYPKELKPKFAKLQLPGLICPGVKRSLPHLSAQRGGSPGKTTRRPRSKRSLALHL
jgi:hypothetical protein